MNVEVTVNALASAYESRINSGDSARLRRVRCRIVALLAEARLWNLEQLLVSSPV